ncbi:uncharacterized protein TRIADDRAFT_52712 [Trichoplax adhaerens]|uniref:Uncharacterized protein n=1 Tax=Trichoplax adhaerens TaxID=10228 RepID=B3RJX5_TRIAD|nr:predicted protein [Trichoplax adhaerens]EDV29138.1 predicted protein [Trichoplax adhaerens]|eukprot:XP_002108340.1 predicted protein [Trichoplax adhaerens]
MDRTSEDRKRFLIEINIEDSGDVVDCPNEKEDLKQYTYQLYCKRANGYLSVESCPTDDCESFKVVCKENRGAGYDHFKITDAKSLSNTSVNVLRLGYKIGEDIGYFLAGKLADGKDAQSVKYDTSIRMEEVELLFVSKKFYKKEEKFLSNYLPLMVKFVDGDVCLFLERSENYGTETKCAISVTSRDKFTLDYLDCVHSVPYESSCHPVLSKDPSFISSSSTENHTKIEHPNINA